MNKIVYKSQAIRTVTWIIIFCIAVTLWPLRLIDETITSASNAQVSGESEAITADYTVKQSFVAQYDFLKDIQVYITESAKTDPAYIIFYDEEENIILNKRFFTRSHMKGDEGFCTIPLNLELEVGKMYTYLLQGEEHPFKVALEERETAGNIYSLISYHNNVEDDDHAVITRYDYSQMLRKSYVAVIDAVLLVIGSLVHFLTGKYYGKHPEKDVLRTVEWIMRVVLIPVMAVICGTAFICIWPLKLFTENVPTIIFMEVGVVLAFLVVLYGLVSRKYNKLYDGGLSRVKKDWVHYIQCIAFAGALYACVNYMNALYEIQHTIAYRQLILFFAGAIIITYSRKEIFNIYNIVYAVAAAITGYLYYTKNLPILLAKEDQRFIEDEITVLKLDTAVGIVAGFVILNTLVLFIKWVIGLIKKTAKLPSFRTGSKTGIIYGLLVLVYFTLIIINRGNRGWPIYLVVIFSLFYIRMSVWPLRKYLMSNLCNGVLLGFIMMMVYCWFHRPYMFFLYNRYSMNFHTVTIAAVYISTVVVAALVKFLDAYRKRGHLSECWKELTMLGLASAYLIMTLSRTGYLAVVVAGIIVLLVSLIAEKQKLKALLVNAGLVLISIVVCFPIAFTAQRIIPSVIARPVTFEIESLPVTITQGRTLDSGYYMSFPRFIECFESKVLDMEDNELINNGNVIDEEDLYVGKAQKKYREAIIREDYSRLLYASADDSIGDVEAAEAAVSDAEKYANGRFDIFKAYINNFNMWGHDDQFLALSEDVELIHAHNIYIQNVYDFGIPMGLLFVVLGGYTFVQGVIYFIRHSDDRKDALLPMAAILIFAVAGLTEWIFHPCHPSAFVLLATFAPLIFDMKKDSAEEEQ